MDPASPPMGSDPRGSHAAGAAAGDAVVAAAAEAGNAPANGWNSSRPTAIPRRRMARGAASATISPI